MIILVITLIAFIGAPLFAVFGALTLYAYHAHDLDFALVVSEMGRLATMPLLQTLPMFALAGYVLARSQASRRLVRLSKALLGWMPGGLAIVAVLACTLLTAFTGASGVTIIALGGLLFPALLAEQYEERFSLGLITVSGSLGILFAPSLPLILYGVIAHSVASDVTIDKLFRAGILPGLLITLMICLYGVGTGMHRRLVRTPFRLRELLSALWAAGLELPLPFIVLGGIYTGRLAISEAAVITAAYAIIVEVIIFREIRLRDLAGIVRESMVLVGGILVILGIGMAMTNFLVDQEVPGTIFDAVQAHIHSRLGFLVALNVFLLIVGCIMDIFTAIVVLVPLIVPVALQYGVDPVHLGIILLTNMGIGYSTPPIGMNLFIASIRFNKPILTLYRACVPFLLILLLALVLITYIPALSLWLVP